MFDTTFSLKSGRIWEIYFFMVLSYVLIFWCNYQGFLWCSVYLTMHPMIVWRNPLYSIFQKPKKSCSNSFIWSKVGLNFINFFEVFILPQFNEVFLLCHRIDWSILSVELDLADKIQILLGRLSNFIRICIKDQDYHTSQIKIFWAKC